jgi:hypothetical protein
MLGGAKRALVERCETQLSDFKSVRAVLQVLHV